MRVLVACEFSGIVRDAFIKVGHYAVSCDLLDSESNLGVHYKDDVRKLLNCNWDLMIAHPPCTYLCNSGVRWLTNNPERYRQMQDAAYFFKRLLQADIDKVCIENPIMHKYAKEIIGVDQTQIIQPWQYGHGETKATCLWLKNLPKLEPTNIVEGREARMHSLSPSKDRSKLRSITYKGISEAMAQQWGSI